MQKSNWRKEVLNEKLGPLAALTALGKGIGAAGEVVGGALSGAGAAAGTAKKAVQTVGKAISGREKTASQKRIIKTGGIKAARDRDGDGKLEKYNKTSGSYSEALLYDVVHDYIIAENFASDTEGANKVMLKLSDELMQEIYERTMTASEKRKDTMLKKKYDDSDMKKNMQAQYGKEEGKKVYFATIRKQAMNKEEVESVEEKIKYDKSGSSMDYFLGADPKKTEYYKKNAKKKTKKEEVEVVNEVSKKTLGSYVKKAATEIGTSAMKGDYKKMQKRHKGVLDASDKLAKEEVIPEAKVDQGKDDASKINTRNQRTFGNRRDQKGGGHSLNDMEARRYNTEKGRGVKMRGKKDKTPVNYHKRDSDKRVDALLKGMKEEVGIATHSMMMKDKAKKEAMLRMKEREAVAKKLKKEEMSNGDKVTKMVKAVTDEKKRKNALQIQKYIGEVKRDEYGDLVGGPKISKKEKEKNLKKNTPDEQHTTTTAEGYGSDRVGPALTMARVIDKVNPKPKPTSKRTRVSRALKMASIKKDEKIRKRQENPYSADKRLKMVATSIRDRVKQKARAMTRSEEVVTELNKGGTAKKDLAFQAVMKKYGSQRMGANEPKKVKGVKSDEGTGRITKMLAKKKEQQAKSKALDAKAKKAGYKSTQDYVNVQAVRKGGLGT